MRRIVALGGAGLLLGAAVGTAAPAQPSPGPAIHFAAGGRTAPIPFDADFGLIFLRAAVNGGPPLTFLLDTGFEGSALDAGRARAQGLAVHDSSEVAAPGGAIEVGKLAAASLAVSGLEISALVLDAIPLAGLASVIGRRLDGIIGHDVLERLVVVVDHGRREVQFFDPATFDPKGRGEAVPVEIVGREPLVAVSIVEPGRADIVGRFKLDTGSADVAGLNKNFLESARLPRPGARTLAGPGAAVGGETAGIVFRVGGLRLGSFLLRSPVIGATLDSSGFENRADAGTIGGGLLSRFTLVLDLPHGRILLAPNASTREGPAEDRCGLLLVAEGDDFSLVRVRWVAGGSPAAAAGVRPGDVVTAVDGRAAAAVGLAGLWQLFQGPEGTAHRLRFSREGHEREVAIRLAAYL